MAYLLNLGGYLGPRAEDAPRDSVIKVSEEIATISADAMGQGIVLTAKLEAVKWTPEIGAAMSKAADAMPYLQAKLKAAELAVAPSIAERLAAEKGNNGKGGR